MLLGVVAINVVEFNKTTHGFPFWSIAFLRSMSTRNLMTYQYSWRSQLGYGAINLWVHCSVIHMAKICIQEMFRNVPRGIFHLRGL